MSDGWIDSEDDQDYECEIVHETAKAWLVRDEDGEEFWLPKSRCCDNGDGTFAVPNWLAREKGMLQ